MAIGTTAPSSARVGATSSTMLSPEDTGRPSNSERLTLPQIAVSGSGGSPAGAADKAAAGSAAVEEASTQQRVRRRSMGQATPAVLEAQRPRPCGGTDTRRRLECSLSEQSQRNRRKHVSSQRSSPLAMRFVFEG